ncbi:MAG: phytoene/squalene synthase family protein [Candidatus Levybacteria bacterium]|nr:phytoene/squalene synthase family protein [Candidatus Levybacteria bacterium]
MTRNNSKFQIFKNGSKTYFYSSLFFPKDIKQDVFTLYAFVRTVDNLVDQIPQKKNEFYQFKQSYQSAFVGSKIDNDIVTDFIALMKKRKFKKKWVDDFFDAMESDLRKNPSMKTMNELKRYMYGSAEVIGLMMSQIMSLNTKAHTAAKMQGRAMQYINFIRDIDEDRGLNRQYIPQNILESVGLKSLKNVKEHNDAFSRLVRQEISVYKAWQAEANKGFRFIPIRYRIPVKTASRLYSWTANEIEQNPSIVFSKKVKPSIARIIGTLVLSVFI